MDQEEELRRVEALIDLGRLDEARRLLAAVLAADPTSAAALRLLALCDYFDRALTGSLGWGVVTTWILMLVLLFTSLPLAWVVAAGVAFAYVLWLTWMLRTLPPRVRGIAWSRIRSQPPQLARLVVAVSSAAVALGVGVAASRLDPSRDPIPVLLPDFAAIAVAFVAGVGAVIAVDRRAARRADEAPGTAMDVPLPFRAAIRLLAFRCFTAALVPAIVLFGAAVDPGTNPWFRAGLGTLLLVGLAFVTRWVARRPMSDAALARWSRLPDVALAAFCFGWLVLIAFLLGAAYLPTGTPLLLDVLAVGAVVVIACGLLVVIALVVAAMLRLWRLLCGGDQVPG